jgi:hypothetical protein
VTVASLVAKAPATTVTTDPNAAAADQSAYFREEQAELSPAAIKALELRGRGTASGNGSNGGETQGGAALLAAALASNGRAPTATTAKAPDQISSCAFPPGEFPSVTPLRATEPGNSLRIKSRSAQVLCLADASGVFSPRSLVAGVEQQFIGRAPWKLQAERLAELEIVFQGLPLRKPSYVKDRMELLERS